MSKKFKNPLSVLYNSKNKDGAIKNDGDKPRMSLIPQLAKMELARAMQFGEFKYETHNWTNGFKYSYLLDAIERHLTLFNCGEDIDEESGINHLALLIANAAMLYDNTIFHPEKDDRCPIWKTPQGKIALLQIKRKFEQTEYLKDILKRKNNEVEVEKKNNKKQK